jgi:catechol 2,3-dioxygenase-like lactoylglutathione lyase family enzyme
MLTLQHVTINTKDVDKSTAFYEEVFGFKKTERPNFPFPGAWLWIEPERTMLHLQNTDLLTGSRYSPVDHIALDASYPGKDIILEYERWCDFLMSIRYEWDLDYMFKSFDPTEFLQIFITDPINSVKWELNFPIEKLQR